MDELKVPASNEEIAAVVETWPLPLAWHSVLKTSNGFCTDYKYASPPFEAYDTHHFLYLKQLGITIKDDPYRLLPNMVHILPIAEDASGGFYGLDISTMTEEGECEVVHFEGGEEDGRTGSIFQFLEESLSEEAFERFSVVLPNSSRLTEDKQGALVSAAERGHLKKVKSLLAEGADINYAGDDGFTALISTTWGEHEAVMEFLVNSGADVNRRSTDGRTCLTEAARIGNSNMVQLLLHNGADVDVNCKNGTALYQSIHISHQTDNIAHMLLEHGANPNLGNSVGTTPLFMAVSKNDTNLILDLVAHGADVSQKGPGGMNALSWAWELKKLEAIAVLEQASVVG